MSDKHHEPAACNTREDVRHEIDRLDKALVELMAERWQYVHRMSEIKTSPQEANVPSRVQEVIDNIVTQANAKNFPPELAEAIWRKFIDFAIEYEKERIANRQA
ncbi:MAG: chorismate mutase [Pseudomonadota bacterium]